MFFRYQKQLSDNNKNKLKLSDGFNENDEKSGILNDTNPPSIIDYISLNSVGMLKFQYIGAPHFLVIPVRYYNI